MNSSVPSSPQLFSAENGHDTSFGGAGDPRQVEAEVVVDHFPFVLGRHPECDFSFAGRQISRRHCQFFRRSEQLWVEDLNSHNGTHLNGREIHQAEEIGDGDELTLHPYHFRCRLDKSKLRLILEGIEDVPQF